MEPALVKPDGRKFQITANGSDAAFILATVMDAQGNWCPTATNDIYFKVSGPGNYRGGADGDVKPGDYKVHAPGDSVLSAQGGYCKIAVKSTFETGDVTVTATSPNLGTGTAKFTVTPAILEDTIMQGPVDVRSRVSALTGLPDCRIEAAGQTIRYYISQSANVSVEVFSANGSMVKKIPGALRGEGWHPVRFGRSTGISGVQIVRLIVNGKAIAAKRIIVVR